MTTQFRILLRLSMNRAVPPFSLHLRDVQSDNFTCTYNASDGPFFGAGLVNFDMVIRC
jgi:hypothetical protein